MFLLKAIFAVALLILTNSSIKLSLTNPSVVILSVMTVFTVTNILYEIGRIQDSKWKLSIYFCSNWNQMNILSLTCLLWWVVLSWIQRSDASFMSVERWHGRLGLAFSAILQSLGLLQYICLHRKMGQLVVMTIAMVKDMVLFMILFAFCILGFGIAFEGLFGEDEGSGYGNHFSTLQSLFSAIFGGLDFASFQGATYVSVGQGLLIVYTTLIAIVLLNLLIATMANTYAILLSRTEDEWGYLTVRTHDQHDRGDPDRYCCDCRRCRCWLNIFFITSAAVSVNCPLL